MFKDLKENMDYNKEISGITNKNQENKWNFRAVSTISEIKYSLLLLLLLLSRFSCVRLCATP